MAASTGRGSGARWPSPAPRRTPACRARGPTRRRAHRGSPPPAPARPGAPRQIRRAFPHYALRPLDRAARSGVGGQIATISGPKTLPRPRGPPPPAAARVPPDRPRPVAQPVLEPQQGHVEPAAIARKKSPRVQQLLKELVVTREPDFGMESQFPRPKRQSRLNGFGGKRGANGDRAMVVRHQAPL